MLVSYSQFCSSLDVSEWYQSSELIIFKEEHFSSLGTSTLIYCLTYKRIKDGERERDIKRKRKRGREEEEKRKREREISRDRER